MKIHLDHPTQATACGANARSADGVDAEVFRKASDPCGSCARVLRALEAGREVYRSLEPAALEGLAPELLPLSEPQSRMLKELSETSRNPSGTWYFPLGSRRVLDKLASLGLAVCTDAPRTMSFSRIGYAITPAGTAWLKHREGPRPK